jgi:hypothetical protein
VVLKDLWLKQTDLDISMALNFLGAGWPVEKQDPVYFSAFELHGAKASTLTASQIRDTIFFLQPQGPVSKCLPATAKFGRNYCTPSVELSWVRASLTRGGYTMVGLC